MVRTSPATDGAAEERWNQLLLLVRGIPKHDCYARYKQWEAQR